VIGLVGGRRGTAIAAMLVVLGGCGKKGPPLAPLRLVPSRAEELKATRRGSDIELRFTLPKTNANGPGPIDLERVDVYATTVAPGATPPPSPELLSRTYLVGTVPVKPLPQEGGPTTDAPSDDKRPSPGEPAVFVETLTDEKLKPAASKPKATETPAKPESLPFLRRTSAEHPVRVYVLRGATKGGRPGLPSTQVQVPLGDVPGAPEDLKITYTAQALTLTWDVPPAAEDPAAAQEADWMFLAPQFPYLFYRPPTTTTFNVYRRDEPLPVNPTPLAQPEFVRKGVEFGAKQCFLVRSVRTSGAVAVESDPSQPACVTPTDTFPPEAPKGLQAVAGAGEINLSWDPNSERDLAGYIVLRGDAPDATLQALTTAPIPETRYRDAAVTPGVRYFYAVVAVDKASPPNLSPQSARADETAR
jgi:hypothetical protein